MGPVVPFGAMQMSSGNKIVSFTAPGDGKAYLRDDTDVHVIYSAELRKNQVLTYDPQLQQITVDGAVVASKIDGKNHDHSILYERIARPQDAARPVDSNSAVDANGVQTIRVPVGVKVDVQPQPSDRR